MREIKILLIVNKIDIDNSMHSPLIINKFKLDTLKHKWDIIETSVLQNIGLYKIFEKIYLDK